MLKNDNFKTQDFSPLIERFLAGMKDDKEYYHTRIRCKEVMTC